MKALVISSEPGSIRYDLLSVSEQAEEALLIGRIVGIGEEAPEHRYSYGKRGCAEGVTKAANHAEACQRIKGVLRAVGTGGEDWSSALTVVVHRVPHGGEHFTGPVVVTDDVMRSIDLCSVLAPRRNPASLMGIRAARAVFSGVPQVAVFDTAYFHTMPMEAYLYAMPYSYYERLKIRRYGFHGVSHRVAVEAAAKAVGRPSSALKIVSLHLGDECSVAAVANGICVDTSCGLTPREGLPGATSSGDIDPTAVTLLMRTEGWGADEMDDLLGNQAGVLGMSQVSPDLMHVLNLAEQGNELCGGAVRVFVYRVVKAIGALAAAMGGLDVLVFTSTYGEQSPRIRAHVCDKLSIFGVELDPMQNEACEGVNVAKISADESKVRVIVVPADEERTVAREAIVLVTSRDSA